MQASSSKSKNAKKTREKVVLAYSGGLDTSVAIKWLEENYGLDTVAVCINVGQPGDMEANIERAKSIGAVGAYAIDAKEEFATEYIWPALKANAMYQDVYPLSTAIARPLIAKILVDVAKKEGAKYIAHGCTAKGNDQVRFDVSIAALDPKIGIIAPMREWVMTREEEIDYAKEHGVPIPVKKACPYSTDENLWGRSCECGILEDASVEPPEDSHEWTVSPLKAPAKPTYVEIGFDKGIPVSIDGKKVAPVELIQTLNEIAGQNGVGRIDHIEDRMVGIKSRETYECPAAIVLIKAHRALENMVMTRDLLSFKKGVEQRYSDLCYDGMWFSPLKSALDAFIDKSQENVTGTVRMKLYRGNADAVGRSSPYSLYDEGLATYAEGDKFDHKSAEGFIYVWGLPLRTVASIKKPKKTAATPAGTAKKKCVRKKK